MSSFWLNRDRFAMISYIFLYGCSLLWGQQGSPCVDCGPWCNADPVFVQADMRSWPGVARTRSNMKGAIQSPSDTTAPDQPSGKNLPKAKGPDDSEKKESNFRILTKDETKKIIGGAWFHSCGPQIAQCAAITDPCPKLRQQATCVNPAIKNSCYNCPQPIVATYPICQISISPFDFCCKNQGPKLCGNQFARGCDWTDDSQVTGNFCMCPGGFVDNGLACPDAHCDD